MENLGNDEYRRAGRYLLSRLDDNQKLQVGFDNVSFFEQLSDAKWGVFFRSCLAASHIAYNAERGRRISDDDFLAFAHRRIVLQCQRLAAQCLDLVGIE